MYANSTLARQLALSLLIIVCLVCNSLIECKADELLVPSEYTTIQGALNAANQGDTILVSEGLYFESINWPEKQALKLFATSPDAVLQGDGLDIVLTISTNVEISSATIIRGFKIRGGSRGIYVNDGSPTLDELEIYNHGLFGLSAGGIGAYFSYSNSIVQNCTIRNNLSTSDSHSFGGGIAISDSDLTLKNCLISSNSTSGLWSFGGGIWIGDNSHLICENTIIEDNHVLDGDWGRGGGIYCDSDSSCEIESSIITGNRINDSPNWADGAGIYLNSESSSQIRNTIISYNIVQGSIPASKGTGVYLEDEAVANLEHVTVTGNRGTGTIGRAISAGADAVLNVNNSIVWSPDQLAFGLNESTISSITYSNLSAGGAMYPGEGNINSDPLLDESMNYELLPDSPCIDVGNPNNYLEFDFEGNQRPYGDGPDLGAQEFISCPSDIQIPISATENSLIADFDNATFQWLNCAEDFAPVPGETGNTFTSTEGGEFAVEVIYDENLCKDTSFCFVIMNTSIEEANEFKYRLFPNPSNGISVLELAEPLRDDLMVSIKTLQGSEISSQSFFGEIKRIEIKLPAEKGMYLMELVSNERLLGSQLLIRN